METMWIGAIRLVLEVVCELPIDGRLLNLSLEIEGLEKLLYGSFAVRVTFDGPISLDHKRDIRQHE